MHNVPCMVRLHPEGCICIIQIVGISFYYSFSFDKGHNFLPKNPFQFFQVQIPFFDKIYKLAELFGQQLIIYPDYDLNYLFYVVLIFFQSLFLDVLSRLYPMKFLQVFLSENS